MDAKFWRFLALVCFVQATLAICPTKCTCKNVNENGNTLRVKCGGTVHNKITSVKELDFGEDSDKVLQLDLSKNQISHIESTDFLNFTNLKRLDLSFNSLQQIDESMFGEISTLERLKLSTNIIVHIFQGSFEMLRSLKQLDISGNPLACDCDLLWLVGWSNNMSVKLQPPPKCESPSDFKGSVLKKLKVGSDLHCESPLQPLLELHPDKDQLVFEGDELVLRCRAPRVAVGAPRDSEDLPAKAHVFWGWSDKIVDQNTSDDIYFLDPSVHFPSIQIDAKHLSDSGLLDSILHIPYVTRNHSGMWDCRLRSHQANLSRTVSVFVISDKTKYCEGAEVRNNKGRYYWPRTIRGMEVKLPCVGEAATHLFAMNFCNLEGEWEHLNTEMCPYISETTRILEQFAKVNLSIARGSVLESAKRLRNYTQSQENLLRLRDPTDFVFVAKTLNNYLDFLRQEKDLGSMLLDIVSQLLYLPHILSYRAEISNSSATDVAQAVEKAALHTQASLTHKNNLAIEYFNVRPDTFTGITCTWYRSEQDREKRTFQCNTASHTMEMFRQHVDASIQVPSSFLELPASQNLMVAVYQNSNLFPYLKNGTNFKVTSAVIGVKLFSDTTPPGHRNLSEPISVMLRVQPFHNEISAPVPVRWDADLNEWTSDGCQFLYYFHTLLVFSCSELGYYGLLQNKKYLNDFLDENAGAQFRVSPIGFYIGGLVLFLCSWINIVTYISSGGLIQMGRRQKHSLVNSWVALSLLCLLFTVGIFQTEDHRVCQIFGISIHYFSLCVVLWVCVSVSNMYKRLSKRNRVPMDDLPKENVGRKPILGLYLVGYGIGLIICGISGAVNIREYASYSYCFLRSGPALSAMFVPATILLLFLAILFVCVRCHIRMSNEHNGHLSEGTQGTENVDLELLETSPNGHMNHSDRYRSLTLSSPTTSLQDDLEHTNGAQLRAHFIFLFLYTIAWLSAAASISTPFQRTILYEEELFSALFAIASCLLGVFILFFYGVSRSDVRRHWSSLSCRNVCSHSCCRTRAVIDLKEQNTVTYHQTCSTMNSTSRSNSQCSKNRPPSASNQLKMHSELNSAATLPRNDSPSKLMTSPANVMLINRQQFVHNPVMVSQDIPNADMFYNPNQINVARKFFKKQKRLAKRSNFDLQRQIERGDFGDGGASDISSSVASSYPKATRGMSIFSSGSKVNNTNIHIKNLAAEIGQFSKDSRQQSMNPNILSDSCNESDLIVDAERLVLGAAEGLRALNTRSKLNNTSEMVANIYTNVPETSQPQHEIVTMRADDKFRKSANVNDLLEQDELDMERNDLNSRDSDRTSTPLYVNTNIRNIMDETLTPEHDLDESQVCSEDMISDMCNSHNISEQPNAAMNTVGLPIGSASAMNTSNDENMLELDRNEAYISEPLEISDRVYTNDSLETPELIPQAMTISQKSKSLLSLDALTAKPKANKCSDSFHESQVRSISCTNLPEAGDEILGAIANPLPAKPAPEKRLLSSPVLFSPSLCEIDDLPSPDDRRKPINLINDDMSSNSDSLNLFSQSIRRNYVSSPTCESDLNYQNSELSIRSHGVYAPQPDNDLNITLTGEDNMFFPYQSSEVSDIDDDENDFDDFNNCSNDCLLPPQDAAMHEDDELMDDSHESIDELYQRITRRPNTSSMIVNSGGSIGDIDLSTMPINSSGAGEDVVEELEVSNENDDDSSQCSVISYIDPNGAGGTKE
ncbi:unnamed protein product [Hermetia illucens]|uniref:Uncharacterized protein n=1 Tax=Hermetia illucens TaxID=343691 RepID=A0A7R8Z0U3_HERIL|nr:adhesion G protein-coupled receptor A3 [Hermetia illucens]CAD7091368.1 unnamed protein product [Hermetia illucens]